MEQTGQTGHTETAMAEDISLADRVDRATDELSELGLTTFTMLVLCRLAYRAQHARQPVSGVSAIDFVTNAAKEYFLQGKGK